LFWTDLFGLIFIFFRQNAFLQDEPLLGFWLSMSYLGFFLLFFKRTLWPTSKLMNRKMMTLS